MVAIRVYNGLFGPDLKLAALRMGDLVAVCNFLEYIREKTDNPYLQMCIPDEVVWDDHCIEFRDWLIFNTDYVCKYADQLIELQIVPGTDATYPYMYNLWNIRKDVSVQRQNVFHIEDRVILPGNKNKEELLIVCPLLDAPYNANRNWGLELTQKMINSYQWYDYFDKVIICKEPIDGLDIKNFRYSHNFNDNLDLVAKCMIFYGGDTGFSHFAGALQPGPKYLNYLYPKDTYGTTYPFYWKYKGRVVNFDDPKFVINSKEVNEILLPVPVRTE